LRRVKETFQAAGVDMPYPTQVSINKTGDPPPASKPALVSSGRQV
jgi:hypothetical protein